MALEIGLTDRIAVVTGTGGSMGYAVADALAGAGARVMATHVLPTVVEAAGAITDGGGTCEAFVADDSVKEEVEIFFAATAGLLGVADILVNVVGVLEVLPFLATTEEERDRTLGVNLKGTFLCC